MLKGFSQNFKHIFHETCHLIFIGGSINFLGNFYFYCIKKLFPVVWFGKTKIFPQTLAIWHKWDLFNTNVFYLLKPRNFFHRNPIATQSKIFCNWSEFNFKVSCFCDECITCTESNVLTGSSSFNSKEGTYHYKLLFFLLIQHWH